MNNFTYETQGTNTYLVYEIPNEEVVDSMSLGMLTNNKIPGLAQTIFTQIDNKKLIKFNVSSRINVTQFFTGPVNKKRLLGVFSGIVDAMISAEEYMIDLKSLLLNKEYIFADVTTCETVLVCLPVENLQTETPVLGDFFKNIMFSTQFDQTENCDYIAKIINYLNSSPVVSLSDFKELLDQLKKGENNNPAASVQTATVVQTVPTAKTVQDSASVRNSQPVAKEITPQVAPAAPLQPRPVPVQTVTPTPAPVPPIPKTGMAVPPPASGKPVPPAPSKAPQSANLQQTQGEPEKEISFMYLMQHYNKDNAAAYKAQKEKKKQQKAEAKGAPKKAPQSAKPRPAQPQAMPNFAIPGQPAPAPGANMAPRPQQVVRPQQIPVQPQAQQVVRPQQVPAQPQAQQVPVQPKPVATPAPQPQQVVQQQERPFVPREEVMASGMNFGETTVLGGGGIGETTVLGVANNAQQAPQPYLMRVKNNERIPLDKPVFRIGKERSYVDYFVGDNTAVSRSHANIVTKEEQYLIVDTNSTNHTFVNGVMIQSNQAVEIFHGDKIRLANEEFEFNLY